MSDPSPYYEEDGGQREDHWPAIATGLWRLHAFVQACFQSRLRTFRRVPGQTTDATIAEIETIDHTAVPTI